MIVTLTANPSLDRTIELSAPLLPGEVQSAASAREDAAGKGINVARAVLAAGVPVRAVLPLAAGDPYGALLDPALDTVRVPIAGRVRANVTIADPAGVTTKLNLSGAHLTRAELDRLVAAVIETTADARWLVLAGSLPPGAPADFYVEVARAVRAAHGDAAPRIAVDTSGAALAAVVAEGMPDLIKPNDDELAELSGADLPEGPGEIAAVARRLVPGRIGAALVTLGSAGAVLVTAEGAWSAPAPKIRVASTVGAGDSSLAGLLIAEASGLPPERMLVNAIRYGAAAASLAGTQPPTPSDLPDVDLDVRRL